ncbi:DUF6599 family protein, partial [Candidatus Zixiibacteriota bacterium]
KQEVISLVPQPESGEGWQWDFEPEIYTPENLYEYINGEAEVYNDYEFMEMVTASHARRDDPVASVTFDIYDMGTPLNAFGIYSNYRRPELDFGSIGEEAIVSELNVRFWKGNFFVQVNAGSMDEMVKASLPKYAARIADSIGQAELPTAVFILPEEGQVPHTLRYMGRGLLGQEAFSRSFEAKYLLPSGECFAFLVPKESPEEAHAALTAFIWNLHQQSQIDELPDFEGLSAFTADTEYYGRFSAILSGRYVVGVIRYQDSDEAAALIETIRSRLR